MIKERDTSKQFIQKVTGQKDTVFHKDNSLENKEDKKQTSYQQFICSSFCSSGIPSSVLRMVVDALTKLNM